MIEDGSLVGKKFDDFVVRAADDFEYTDTVDGSVTKKQVGCHVNSLQIYL